MVGRTCGHDEIIEPLAAGASAARTLIGSRWLRGVTLCALAFAGLACSAPPEWTGTIEERDGAAFVSNPAEGLWDGMESSPLRFELEQVYGADETPGEAILGGLRELAFDADADSNVYVLDGQTLARSRLRRLI